MNNVLPNYKIVNIVRSYKKKVKSFKRNLKKGGGGVKKNWFSVRKATKCHRGDPIPRYTLHF